MTTLDLDRLSPFASMESMNMDENVSVKRGPTELKCPRCGMRMREHGSAKERYDDIEHLVRCAAQDGKLSIPVMADGVAALGALASEAK